MDEAVAHSAEDRTTEAVARITGRPPTTLEAFLAEHRAEFRRKGEAPDG